MDNRDYRITEIVRSLQEAGIVQAFQDSVELSHDSLALQIAQKRTGEEKELIRQARMVLQKYMIPGDRPDYLSAEQWEEIRANLPQLEQLWEREGKPEVKTFVEQSRKEIERKIEKEKNILRAKIIGVSAFILLLLISIIAITKSYLDARDSKATAIASLSTMNLTDDPSISLRLAEAACNISPNNRYAKEALTNAYLSGPFHYFFPEQSGRLMFAVFSPDGRYIASGGKGESVRLVDVYRAMAPPGPPESAIIELEYPSGKRFTDVWEIVFDASGQRLMVGGKNTDGEGWAVIWNLQGRFLRELIHGGEIYACKFSPADSLIATGADDNSVRLWKESNQFIEMKKHTQLVADIDWSKDGMHCLSASYDGRVLVWSKDGRLEVELKGHEKGIDYARFSPDGNYILTSSDDKQVIIWDRKGNPVRRLLEHKDAVHYAAFSPDGQLVVTASGDNTSILWNWKKDTFVKLEGHTDLVFRAQFSPNGRYVITAGYDKQAIIWDLYGKPVKKLKGHRLQVQYAEISPDTTRFLAVTAGKDYKAGLWDIGSCIGFSLSVANDPFEMPQPADAGMYYAEFSSGENLFLTAGQSNRVQLWDNNGRQIKRFDPLDTPVLFARFLPDGKKVLVVYEDQSAYLINLETNSFQLFKKFPSKPSGLSFSPDGNMVAVSFKRELAVPEKVSVYNLTTGKLIAEKQHEKDVNSVEFSKDGSRLLSASQDQTVKVWALNDSVPALTIRNKIDEPATYAVFSPDGKFIISAWRDNYIRVHDLHGNLIRQFEAHSDRIIALDCCQYNDGQVRIASASYDASVKVWSLDGQEKMRFTDHWDRLRSVRFSPGGRFLISASDDGTVKLWPVLTKHSAAAILSPDAMLKSLNVFREKGIVNQLDSAMIKNYGIE